MFLSSFAVLYVIGGFLPKTDFLTVIDKVGDCSTDSDYYCTVAAVLAK